LQPFFFVFKQDFTLSFNKIFPIFVTFYSENHDFLHFFAIFLKSWLTKIKK